MGLPSGEMSVLGVKNAIPPVYAEYAVSQLVAHLLHKKHGVPLVSFQDALEVTPDAVQLHEIAAGERMVTLGDMQDPRDQPSNESDTGSGGGLSASENPPAGGRAHSNTAQHAVCLIVGERGVLALKNEKQWMLPCATASTSDTDLIKTAWRACQDLMGWAPKSSDIKVSGQGTFTVRVHSQKVEARLRHCFRTRSKNYLNVITDWRWFPLNQHGLQSLIWQHE